MLTLVPRPQDEVLRPRSVARPRPCFMTAITKVFTGSDSLDVQIQRGWTKGGTLREPFESPAGLGRSLDRPGLARTIERLKESSMKNIFVGNLDFAATESSLRSLF